MYIWTHENKLFYCFYCHQIFSVSFHLIKHWFEFVLHSYLSVTLNGYFLHLHCFHCTWLSIFDGKYRIKIKVVSCHCTWITDTDILSKSLYYTAYYSRYVGNIACLPSRYIFILTMYLSVTGPCYSRTPLILTYIYKLDLQNFAECQMSVWFWLSVIEVC